MNVVSRVLEALSAYLPGHWVAVSEMARLDHAALTSMSGTRDQAISSALEIDEKSYR